MARKAAVVLNREAMGEFDRAIVTGLEVLAFTVAEKVDPIIPDAPPYDEGLTERGVMWLSYLDGKKVGGDPRVEKKPKAFKVRGRGASVAVGMGFPSRFIEFGTVDQPPRPFFTPVVMDVVGDGGAVRSAMQQAFAEFLGSKKRRLIRKYNLGSRDLG